MELNSNEPAILPAVTRIVVVGDRVKELEEWNLWANGVEVHLQDDGRTLKIFPRRVDDDSEDFDEDGIDGMTDGQAADYIAGFEH